MENRCEENGKPNIDFYLDITPEVCPLTFVKTKLLLERMQPGQVAEVRLKGGEPLENVPRSVREHGHEVLALEAEEPGGGVDTPHRLLIRRA
ncbi:MAG: sulfurtransferase TusA family protein [Hyphomicrobiales bacterium]|nr:sulfurtransferase TusA family protein [Hyphomicrobiales bacterium]MCP5370168.1 sulfurtransferase TusA family protein [Hyphomicrobiales bacterium]